MRGSSNPDDRRSVLVEITDLTGERDREFFEPLAAVERELLARHSPRELRTIRTFLDDLASAFSEYRPEIVAATALVARPTRLKLAEP